MLPIFLTSGSLVLATFQRHLCAGYQIVICGLRQYGCAYPYGGRAASFSVRRRRSIDRQEMRALVQFCQSKSESASCLTFDPHIQWAEQSVRIQDAPLVREEGLATKSLVILSILCLFFGRKLPIALFVAKPAIFPESYLLLRLASEQLEARLDDAMALAVTTAIETRCHSIIFEICYSMPHPPIRSFAIALPLLSFVEDRIFAFLVSVLLRGHNWTRLPCPSCFLRFDPHSPPSPKSLVFGRQPHLLTSPAFWNCSA